MSASTLPVSWLRDLEVVDSRAAGIGGTDISAILGFNPYKSPFDVYLEKTGQGMPVEESGPLEWGLRLEPVVASAYADKRRTPVIKNSLTYRHPRHRFMTGTPDYFLEFPRGLDCKTSSFWLSKEWGEEGTDEVPDHYLAQCQWYMALTGAEAWDVPVLIGGNDFRVYTIARNEELIASMIEAGALFWEKHVQAGTPPVITPSEGAQAWLKQRFPRHKTELRAASVEETELAARYLVLKEQAAQTEADMEALAVQLKAFIGEAEGIAGAFGKITWKANKDSAKTDYKALALSFKPTPEQIAAFTTTTPGARPFKATPAK